MLSWRKVSLSFLFGKELSYGGMNGEEKMPDWPGEIRSGRGTLYDLSVVDACIEEFEENPAIIRTE